MCSCSHSKDKARHFPTLKYYVRTFRNGFIFSEHEQRMQTLAIKISESLSPDCVTKL